MHVLMHEHKGVEADRQTEVEHGNGPAYAGQFTYSQKDRESVRQREQQTAGQTEEGHGAAYKHSAQKTERGKKVETGVK